MLRLILILLPLVLPTYVVRFRIGHLPTTLLELLLLCFLIIWTCRRGLACRPKPWCGLEGWKSALQRLRSSGWFAPLILWLLAGAIGIFVAPDHLGALGLWRAYFLEPILIFLMLTDLVKTNEDQRLFIRSLVSINVLIAVWAVIQFITGLGIPAPWNALPAGMRATGPFPYPNALALFAVPISALCFSYLKIRNWKLEIRNWILWLGFLSGLAATLLAKSDGGLIALLVAALTALIIHRRTRIPAILVTLFSLSLLFSIPASRNSITEKIFFQDWSGKVRLVMWQETAEMLADHPIFGAGLGAYPDVIKPYHTATWMEIFQYPHNILLNLWSEVGMLGILAFTWMLILWIKRAGIIALPIIAALLIHGLVDVPYFKNDLAVMFWILIAATSATRKITVEEYPPCGR